MGQALAICVELEHLIMPNKLLLALLCLLMLAQLPLHAQPTADRAQLRYSLTWDIAAFLEGKTHSDIAALPQRLSVRTEAITPSTWDDELPSEASQHAMTWTRYFYTFQGFEVTGAESSAGEFHLEQLRFTAPNTHLPTELQIGAAESQVRALLGEPDELAETSLVYHAQSNTLLIDIAAGKVQAVEIYYYFDI